MSWPTSCQEDSRVANKLDEPFSIENVAEQPLELSFSLEDAAEQTLDLWLLLTQRGLIGQRTCRVFRATYQNKLMALPTLVTCALSTYLALEPDPVLAGYYSELVCLFVFGGWGILFFFCLVLIGFGRRAVLSEICLEVARCSLSGPLRPGLRRGQYSANLYDPPSFRAVVCNPRVWLLFIGFCFRTGALFLWEGPGVTVWALWAVAMIHDVAVAPALEFIMDMLLALSDDLIEDVRNLIKSYPDVPKNSDESFWRLVSKEYRKLAAQLEELWSVGASHFWLRVLMTFLVMMSGAVGAFAAELKKTAAHELVAFLFASIALMYCLMFVLRLYRIANITSQCMSNRARSGSIRIEALKHCGESMTSDERAEYNSFLTQLSLTRCGVHVGVFVDKNFVVKVAVPIFTLFSSVFTLALAKLHLD